MKGFQKIHSNYTYKLVRDDLSTGDLVLFSGKGFVSWIIKKFTKSKWSHVGMVIDDPHTNTKLIWESTTLTSVKDFVDGKMKRGVSIRALSERIENYKGDIAVNILDLRLSKDQLRLVGAMRHEFRDTPYERNMFELAFSALDRLNLFTTKDTSSLFCSELVAHVLIRLGFLTGHTPANEYTPADFAEGFSVDN